MKKSFKTFEEFIGDETVNSLRKKAIELQQKDHDEIYVDGAEGGVDDGDGEGVDNDSSGDEMGAAE